MDFDERHRQFYMAQRNAGWRYAYYHLTNGTLTLADVHAYADREIHPVGYVAGLREGIADYEEERGNDE